MLVVLERENPAGVDKWNMLLCIEMTWLHQGIIEQRTMVFRLGRFHAVTFTMKASVAVAEPIVPERGRSVV
jgi:hypothetical protein